MRNLPALKLLPALPAAKPQESTPVFDRLHRKAHGDGAPVKAERPSLTGIVGYLCHSVACLFLAIAGLAYFGSLFWFFSALLGALAVYSLCFAAAGLRAYHRWSKVRTR